MASTAHGRVRNGNRVVCLRDRLDSNAVARTRKRHALVRVDVVGFHSRTRTRRSLDRSRADRLNDPVRFLGTVQWVMGLLAVATLPFYVASFDWIGAVINTVQANESGYRIFLLTKYLIALLVMLPATFCAGMTLPLITRMLMRAGAGERAIGAVYAVNTLGSIAGVILAGLLLMPLLGLKKLLVLGALVDIGLG